MGDVAATVGAVASAGALVAASVAAVVSWRALRLEHRRDERAQASAVDGWEARAPEGTGSRAFDVFRPWGVMVGNASAVPVRSVTVTWYSHDRGQVRAQVTVPVVEPGGSFVARPEELRRESGRDEKGNPVYAESANGFPFTLRFRDAAGAWWSRDMDGVLRRED